MTPTDPQARLEPMDDAIPPQPAATRGETPEPAPGQRLAELEAKHAEVSDAYLRAKAEAENTRRRAEEEIAKARKFALESFAESLLPVRDSLEAATAIANASNEQLLRRRARHAAPLSQALERNEVVEINPAGGHQVRSAPAPGHQRGAGRPGGQHRRGGAAKGLPDRRARAAPGPGHRGCAQMRLSPSRQP